MYTVVVRLKLVRIHPNAHQKTKRSILALAELGLPPHRELLRTMVKPNEVSRLEDEVRRDDETEEECLFCNETTLRTVSKQKLAPQALKNEFQVLQVRVF